TLTQIFESFRFAWRALKSNLLRTILSLLGVTIGIFAIITVLTLVDSLEKNIKDSFNFLGSGVIYTEKWPFPGGEGEYRWWDFWRRPNVSYDEYQFLQANLKSDNGISIFAFRGGTLIRRKSNSIGDVRLVGAALGYTVLFPLDLDQGRFPSPEEINSGRNVCIIGFEVANALFPNGESPLGKEIKAKNLKYIVIGVVKKEGQSFLGTPSNDYSVIIPYKSFRQLY